MSAEAGKLGTPGAISVREPHPLYADAHSALLTLAATATKFRKGPFATTFRPNPSANLTFACR